MFSLPASELRYLLKHRTQKGRALHGRPLRTQVFAYAQPTRIQDTGRSPRDVLGVEADADGQQIKTAFRKLALKYHPDHQGGDEQRFVEILRAYEILVGKADGKDGREHADWDFHDWYWKFTTLRKQGKASTQRGRFRADLPSQLAGLRQRAAVRAAKARAVQRTSSSEISFDPAHDYQDDAESPTDCGAASSSTMTEDQMRRCDEEARRRAQLNSSETKESISSQLTGLKRRAQMRQEM